MAKKLTYVQFLNDVKSRKVGPAVENGASAESYQQRNEITVSVSIFSYTATTSLFYRAVIYYSSLSAFYNCVLVFARHVDIVMTSLS